MIQNCLTGNNRFLEQATLVIGVTRDDRWVGAINIANLLLLLILLLGTFLCIIIERFEAEALAHDLLVINYLFWIALIGMHILLNLVSLVWRLQLNTARVVVEVQRCDICIVLYLSNILIDDLLAAFGHFNTLANCVLCVGKLCLILNVFLLNWCGVRVNRATNRWALIRIVLDLNFASSYSATTNDLSCLSIIRYLGWGLTTFHPHSLNLIDYFLVLYFFSSTIQCWLFFIDDLWLVDLNFEHSIIRPCSASIRASSDAPALVVV